MAGACEQQRGEESRGAASGDGYSQRPIRPSTASAQVKPCGLRPDGTLPDDFAEEARQAWRNVAEALGAAGAQLTDIVSVRQWLTSADDIPVYAAVRSEVIKHEPTFMLGVLSGLVWPQIRVEIEVTAVRPARA